MRRAPLLALPFLLALLLAGGTASAQVHIGGDVFVGGHRVAPGDYRSVQIEMSNLPQRWHGCRWFRPGSAYHGKRIRVRTRVCQWQQVPYGKKRR